MEIEFEEEQETEPPDKLRLFVERVVFRNDLYEEKSAIPIPNYIRRK